MWLSWLVSTLFCGQLLVAAAATGSSRHNLPRIQPRYAQRGGSGKGTGFPGGGFGIVTESLLAPPRPHADPKAILGKAPKGMMNPASSTPPQSADSAIPLGDALSATGTAVAPGKATPPKDPPVKGPPEGIKPPVNPLGGALAALGTALAPPSSSNKGILISTSEDAVKCRQYPDTVSPESANVITMPKDTQVRVTCWTSASISGSSGKVQGSSIWLRTIAGCYIPEMNVQSDANFEKRLATCEPVHHLVGTMQTQYKRQDCYNCTSTNCASKNIGQGFLIDLGCVTIGEATGGNTTWVKHASESCFFPGAIFQPQGWLGSGGGFCAPGTGAAGNVGPKVGT